MFLIKYLYILYNIMSERSETLVLCLKCHMTHRNTKAMVTAKYQVNATNAIEDI